MISVRIGETQDIKSYQSELRTIPSALLAASLKYQESRLVSALVHHKTAESLTLLPVTELDCIKPSRITLKLQNYDSPD